MSQQKQNTFQQQLGRVRAAMAATAAANAAAVATASTPTVTSAPSTTLLPLATRLYHIDSAVAHRAAAPPPPPPPPPPATTPPLSRGQISSVAAAAAMGGGKLKPLDRVAEKTRVVAAVASTSRAALEQPVHDTRQRKTGLQGQERSRSQSPLRRPIFKMKKRVVDDTSESSSKSSSVSESSDKSDATSLGAFGDKVEKQDVANLQDVFNNLLKPNDDVESENSELERLTLLQRLMLLKDNSVRWFVLGLGPGVQGKTMAAILGAVRDCIEWRKPLVFWVLPTDLHAQFYNDFLKVATYLKNAGGALMGFKNGLHLSVANLVRHAVHRKNAGVGFLHDPISVPNRHSIAHMLLTEAPALREEGNRIVFVLISPVAITNGLGELYTPMDAQTRVYRTETNSSIMKPLVLDADYSCLPNAVTQAMGNICVDEFLKIMHGGLTREVVGSLLREGLAEGSIDSYMQMATREVVRLTDILFKPSNPKVPRVQKAQRSSSRKNDVNSLKRESAMSQLLLNYVGAVCFDDCVGDMSPFFGDLLNQLTGRAPCCEIHVIYSLQEFPLPHTRSVLFAGSGAGGEQPRSRLANDFVAFIEEYKHKVGVAADGGDGQKCILTREQRFLLLKMACILQLGVTATQVASYANVENEAGTRVIVELCKGIVRDPSSDMQDGMACIERRNGDVGLDLLERNDFAARYQFVEVEVKPASPSLQRDALAIINYKSEYIQPPSTFWKCMPGAIVTLMVGTAYSNVMFPSSTPERAASVIRVLETYASKEQGELVQPSLDSLALVKCSCCERLLWDCATGYKMAANKQRGINKVHGSAYVGQALTEFTTKRADFGEFIDKTGIHLTYEFQDDREKMCVCVHPRCGNCASDTNIPCKLYPCNRGGEFTTALNEKAKTKLLKARCVLPLTPEGDVTNQEDMHVLLSIHNDVNVQKVVNHILHREELPNKQGHTFVFGPIAMLRVLRLALYMQGQKNLFVIHDDKEEGDDDERSLALDALDLPPECNCVFFCSESNYLGYSSPGANRVVLLMPVLETEKAIQMCGRGTRANSVSEVVHLSGLVGTMSLTEDSTLAVSKQKDTAVAACIFRLDCCKICASVRGERVEVERLVRLFS